VNLFLSWSGEVSKEMAQTLHDWLPQVIQAVKPWMSTEDIRLGQRWSLEIAGILETAKLGILCLTPLTPLRRG
jgi:hypothetical protein